MLGKTAAVLALAVFSGGDSKDHDDTLKPKKTAVHKEASQLMPAPKPRVVKNDQKVFELVQKDYESDGYSVGVVGTNPELQKAFETKFILNNGQAFAKAPKVKEFISIRDKKAFTGKSAEHQRGIGIFNATERSIDTSFISYAAEAATLWRKKHSDSRVRLNGTISAKIGTEQVNRDMVLLNQFPEFINSKVKADAVTVWQGSEGSIDHGTTTHWINLSDSDTRKEKHTMEVALGPLAEDYSKYSSIAVELCQGLVRAHDATILPGQAAKAEKGRDVLDEYNSTADHGLDIYAQEMVCNSLGRSLTAYYFGGSEGLQRLKDNHSALASDEVPDYFYDVFYDLSIADDELTELGAIKQRINTSNERPIVVAGEHPPSVP